ncbi:MAG: CRTAC1 family protein [Candidatus Delongbacteria bacterium]|nr:CRTAC1 family protein [Candidatus Delongbacteria bacterium]
MNKLLIIVIFIILIISCTTQKQLVTFELDFKDLEVNWQESLDKAKDNPGRIKTIKNNIRSRCSKLIEYYNDPEKLYTAYQGYLLIEDNNNADSVKKNIIKKFPKSKFTFELASSEFYDRLRSIWTNDSAKVVVVTELIDKYPETNWRKTMYQYLVASLSKLNKKAQLTTALINFRDAFPEDYLPYTTFANYMYKDKIDTVSALEHAQKGFELSKNYPKLDHYPEMEWNLEKRAACIKAASTLAEILIGKNNFEAANSILNEVLTGCPLTVDDEITLGQVHYLMAKSYTKSGDKDMAVINSILSLIRGDSRNIYSAKSDSLLRKMSGMENSTNNEVLNFARERLGYMGITFTDVSAEYGLSDISAGRIAWGDYDNDGFQDMMLDGSRIFRNIDGNKFIEESINILPKNMKGNGGLWADFNNDGKLDIVTKDPECIRINVDGLFHKIMGNGSIKDNKMSTEGIGVGDVNNDGVLDIYFANYEKNYVFEHDEFYLGMGDGKFKDATKSSGILPKDGITRAGRGVNFGDFDNDKDLDIFVSNYRLTENFLLVNDGKGNFTNKGAELGPSGNEKDGWWGHTIGSEWADYDNDGDLDLFSANLAHPRYIDLSDMSMLYENQGAPNWNFIDQRRKAGIFYEETHSEPAWGDLDNDGHLDLYINNVYEGRRSFLYMSNGDKTFRDATYFSGTRHFNGWGVAFADIDNDGDLDILAAGGKIQLFRNDTEMLGNWLEVKLITKNHSEGIGTRLRLHNDEISLTREVQGGKGTTNQHSLIQHFGLGDKKGPFTLSVIFPDGLEKDFTITAINKIITVKEI